MAEFKNLLKEQSSVKVVLNGGKHEIDDATIPFSIGFDNSVANRQPAHVLLLEIPHKQYQSQKNEDPNRELNLVHSHLAHFAKRKLYDLNKVDFIQFSSPGKHNLIFVLLDELDRSEKKKLLQKTNLRSEYDTWFWFDQIENLGGHVVGYSEELVEIPEQFFAIAPEKGIRKVWHQWVNRWYLTDPVDQCEFRKRAIPATTIQPIAWFVGFLVRFIAGAIMSAVMLVIGFSAFLIGIQSKGMFKSVLTTLWHFAVLYPKEEWNEIFSREFWFEDDKWEQKYKKYSIGTLEFYVPISIVGIAIQIGLWWGLFTSCRLMFMSHDIGSALGWMILSAILVMATMWHSILVIDTMSYKKIKQWREKTFYSRSSIDTGSVFGIVFLLCIPIALTFISTQLYYHIDAIGSGVTIATKETGGFVASRFRVLSIIVAVVSLIVFRKRIAQFISFVFKQLGRLITAFNSWYEESDLRKWVRKSYETKKPAFAMSTVGNTQSGIPKPTKQEIRTNYLKTAFDINRTPDKVDLKNIVAPTKIGLVVQKFKISFWSTKAKVCKPYAK